MKIIFRIAFTLATIALLVTSCAKTTDISYNTLEQISLDAWMKQHQPSVQRLDNGLYIEVLKAPESGATKIEDGDWLELNYTGSDLDGNVFVTRSKEVAEQQGTFTVYTHYVPHKRVIKTKAGMTEAEYIALKRMRLGEKVRIYTPSSLFYGSYGTNFDNGYGGQYALGANKPATMEIEVLNVIKDITAWENKVVETYAKDQLQLEPKDTVGFGANLYVKITKEAPPEYNDKEERLNMINVDSTFRYYYTGRFLDGFVFDTSVDTIALEAWDITKTYKPASYKAASGGLINAFYNAAKSKKLSYDSEFKMVFTSAMGYGANGQTTGTAPYTVIQPYTPLFFEVRILPYKDKEEDKEDGDK